jgi:hypothetical protein
MKKLTKEQEKTRADLVARLTIAAADIDKKLVEVNAMISDLLNPAIETYNAVVSDIESFRDEIVGEMDTYIGERSEKWTESDAGQNYESWKSDWESYDTTALDTIDEIESPETEHGNELEQLNPEPDS